MSRLRYTALSLAVLLFVSACSGGDDEASVTTAAEPTGSTTTTTVVPTTTTTTTTTSTTTTSTTTTTTVPPKAYPKGTLVAFSSDREGTGSLFVVDRADGEIRQVVFGLDTMFAPAWSPDGRSLVYVAVSGSTTRLKMIDVAAAWESEVDSVDVTDGSVLVDQPAWAPDGITIAYRATTAEDVDEIWTIGLDGSGPDLVISNAERPAFSPDGSRMAFVQEDGRERVIAVLELATGAVTVLTDPSQRANDLSWSPDGSQIAYNAGISSLDIWLIDATGGEPRLLAGEEEREWWPCWTGTGEIVYAKFSNQNLHDIWLVDIVSGNMTALVEDPSDDWWPACQPAR